MKATDMLNKVKELIGVELSEEVKLAQATLENGTVIESEDFAAGSEVFIVTEDEKVALPVGDYTLEDGEILVVEEEGIIASIGAAEETPAEEEVEAQEEEMGYATKEELAEVKAMIEEIKSMLESKEEMSEESPNTIKSEETTTKTVYASEEEVELSAEPIAKITHNPEAETKKNLNLFSQKRPSNTADRVMQRIANINK
jgi:cytosine/adenosine deaminase-related metal-dependent hydrolase